MKKFILILLALAFPVQADTLWEVDAKAPKVGCPHPTVGRLANIDLRFYDEGKPQYWKPVGVLEQERRTDVDVFTISLPQTGFYYFRCFNCDEKECKSGEYNTFYYEKLPEPSAILGMLTGACLLMTLRRFSVS